MIGKIRSCRAAVLILYQNRQADGSSRKRPSFIIKPVIVLNCKTYELLLRSKGIKRIGQPRQSSHQYCSVRSGFSNRELSTSDHFLAEDASIVALSCGQCRYFYGERNMQRCVNVTWLVEGEVQFRG